jgi:hypothetical protein
MGNNRISMVASIARRTFRPGLRRIEHLLPVTAGGPSHLANYALAHRSCNEEAGTLSLVEKLRLRDRLRTPLRRRRRR